MYLSLLLIYIPLISCNLNTSDTSINFYLDKYKSNINRHIRCMKLDKLDSFIPKSSTFYDKSRPYAQSFKFRNDSECIDSEINDNYKSKSILNSLLTHDDVPDSHWAEYKAFHRKEYPSPHHEMAALQKWRENLKRVAEHNRQFLAGEQSYSLHLNHLGDMSVTDYFNNILKLFKTIPLFDPAEDRSKTAYRRSLKKRVPKHLDWRRRGFSPRREEQHQCGACYAFAVAHAMQAQLYKKHGRGRELSPQQIVDCSFRDGNMGCDGGSLSAALRYASREGLITERHYPYVGKRGRCKYSSFLVKARARRWATLPAGDEEAMEKALAAIGPLAVGVNAAPFTFQLYRSGIYDDPFCTPWQLNHAMLLVGYTPHYWILLNWWGRNWGENGYIRIRRGFNLCGVANMATYVEL